MSSPAMPTKPPRGVKQGKETSGLLMSVIRTLSASETNEQREKERAKLEKEYKKSDARLDELVAEHAQEIMDVMQKFTLVNEALSAWGTHGEAAVARLTTCRSLLRLRRADLHRLWADARTHHHALTMLTDIERVVVSERETKEYISSGRVLAAAHTIRAALNLADSTLSHVTALQTTKHHLEAKKRELVELIVRRLLQCVAVGEQTFTRKNSSRAALLLAELTKSHEVTDSYLTDITPEYEASLTFEDTTFETTCAVALEALGVLDQLKEATEKFKVQIQNELLDLINTVSKRIIEEGDVDIEPEKEEDGNMQDDESVSENSRPLKRLVVCLVEEFEGCGARHKRLLQLWRSALLKHKLPESCLHTEQHYWSAVQQVMQLLLTEYLEIESVTLAAARGTRAADPTTDMKLSDYFAKKRPQRRREKLFKLADATPPMGGVGGGVVSHAQVPARKQRYPLVCRPDPAHLHATLPALHALIAHIEPKGSGECSLRAFITDYVRSGESERLATAARSTIEAACRAPGAWRERTAPPNNPLLPHGTRHVSILTCVVTSWQCVERTARAARRCGPSGGAYAVKATTQAIATLATQCVSAHTALSPATSRAARWLGDDDIVRFLQSLPNWKALLQHKPSVQELNEAYEREAEILGSSLGDGAVARREIIADMSALTHLALLAESMDWLSMNIATLPALVSAPSAKLPDKFSSDVTAGAAIFTEIQHKCLLLLHLELRIECFHYLGQESSTESETEGAAQLASRLLQFHEQASVLMGTARMCYVTHGLGEMMSAGLVWRWQRQGRDAAVGRLGTLRHCLAALQLPHSGLHRATNYLHLLNCTPEEIITSVKEKGAQFSELEYLNAFKIIAARRGISSTDMRAHHKHLASALGHVGVTV